MLTLSGSEVVVSSMPADRPDDPTLFALVDVDGAVCIHQWDRRSIFPRQTLKWKSTPDVASIVKQLRDLADAVEALGAGGGGGAQAEGGTPAAAPSLDPSSGSDTPASSTSR